MSTLNCPCGVFVSNDEVFICDTYNHRVKKLLRNGQLTTIAGVADSINKSEEAVKLAKPYSVFVSSSDQVYISEWNNRIKKIDRNGVISTIAGTGKCGYGGDGQLAVNAMLHRPYGLFVTDDEEVLFADADNDCVRKIDRNGIISTIAGTGKRGFDGDGQLATSARLYFPTSVFQYKHEIYITDTSNYRVRKIDRNGIISTIAGTGKREYNGDEVLATTANMYPQCVFVHNDEIYISDTFNHRIRKILPNGVITTIAGAVFNKDVIARPTVIYVDVDSQVYFTASDSVKKIDQYGMISTVVGERDGSGYSDDVPFDFSKYPHIGPRKKPKIKPFPKAYHDIVITTQHTNH